MNVHGVAGPLPPAVAALPQASALSTAPGPIDLVALSGMPVPSSPGPESKKAPPDASQAEPQKVVVSPPVTLTETSPQATSSVDAAESWALKLRQSYRREEIPALFDLNAKLLDGKLEGEDFQEAARVMLDATHGSDDQLTARIGRRILFERFRWPDNLTDLTIKMGHPHGCTEQLRGKLSSIHGHSADRTYHTDDGAVSLLLGALETAVPDQETIEVVARVGKGFFWRSQADLKPEIREHESPELDRSLGHKAEGLLQRWHREGHFTWEGEASLEHGRVEVWPGPVLKVLPETERERSEPSGLLKDLDRAWKPEEMQAAQDQLLKLWRQDRPQAEALIGQLVGGQHEAGRSGSRRLNVALGGASRHPELKAAFTPHLQELTGTIRRAQARGELASDNLVGEARVNFVSNLAAAFPEIVTPGWYREEVLPLVLCGEINTSNKAANFVQDLFAGRPELRDLTMQAVTEHENDFYLDHCCRSALHAAVENGWTPSPLEKDWLVSWLYVPHELDKEKPSPLYGNDGFKAAVRATALTLERDPRALEGCELPDRHGRMVSVAAALHDRLLREDSSNFDSYTRSRNPYLYQILESEPKLKEDLFSRVEQEYQAAGSLAALQGDAPRNLHVLSELATAPADIERLTTLLSQEGTRSNGSFSKLVDKLVREPERRRLTDALREEDITAAEVVANGSRSLNLTLCQDFSPSWSTLLQALKPVREAASSCTPVARLEQGQKLMERLLPRVSGATKNESLSRETLGELAVLGGLGAVDPEVRALIRPLIPELDRLQSTGWNPSFRAVREALPHLILGGFAEQIKLTPSSDEQRRLVQEALPWSDPDDPAQLRVVLEAWRQVWQPPARGSGDLGWMEQGFACQTQPELRAEWVRETNQRLQSEGWPSGTSFASWTLCPPMYQESIKALQEADLSLEERASHLSLAGDLRRLVRDRSDELLTAFTTRATDWEKGLLQAHGEHFESAVATHAAVVSTRGDREQNWKELIAPIHARMPPEGYPHLAEAVRLSSDLPGELKSHLDHFNYLLGRLGPERSGEALSVFVHLKQLEGEGVAHPEALQMALAAYINPGGEVETAAGVRETQSSVLLGGINLRKKARS